MDNTNLNIENNKLREEISALTLELDSFKQLTTLVTQKDVK